MEVIAILFCYTAVTSYQFVGGGDILHLIFPDLISADLGKYIIALFVIVFTAIAGMASVAYMDVAIGLLATFTMLIALPILVHHAGGWSTIHRHPSCYPHFQVLGRPHPYSGPGALPAHLPAFAGQPVHVSEVLLRQIREGTPTRAVVGWIIGTVILETVIVALAVTAPACLRLERFMSAPARSSPTLGFTASTAQPRYDCSARCSWEPSSPRLSPRPTTGCSPPSTNLVNDIYLRYINPQASHKKTLAISRLMVVLLGLWALYQSLHIESVLKKSLYAYTIYGAALTPVILATFYWKRATAAGAVASIAVGTVVTVFWDTHFVHSSLPAVVSGRDAIFPALLASLLCLVVVSLFTSPPTEKQLQPFSEA